MICCGGWGAGVQAAEDILRKVHRVDVAKALDPTDPDDYIVIVQRLADTLRRGAEPIETAAVHAALRALDVDWPNLTAAQRGRVVEAARAALGRAQTPVVRAVNAGLRPTGGRVWRDTRSSVRRALPARFQLTPSLSQRDVVAERLVRESSSNFVRDEFGRRRDDLADMARETVARGLEEGLGRDEIASNLASNMSGRIVRSESYWQIVSGAFVNRARTFSQLRSYSDAGIQTYIFEAVLDEVTSDQCRLYHGQSFSTDGGLRSMEAALESTDPESIRETNPWIRSGRDADGNRILFFERGGSRVLVAQVDRSAVGSRDDRGSFSRAMTPVQLERAGLPYPPLHGRCRSTIIGDVI